MLFRSELCPDCKKLDPKNLYYFEMILDLRSEPCLGVSDTIMWADTVVPDFSEPKIYSILFMWFSGNLIGKKIMSV